MGTFHVRVRAGETANRDTFLRRATLLGESGKRRAIDPTGQGKGEFKRRKLDLKDGILLISSVIAINDGNPPETLVLPKLLVIPKLKLAVMHELLRVTDFFRVMPRDQRALFMREEDQSLNGYSREAVALVDHEEQDLYIAWVRELTGARLRPMRSGEWRDVPEDLLGQMAGKDQFRLMDEYYTASHKLGAIHTDQAQRRNDTVRRSGLAAVRLAIDL